MGLTNFPNGVFATPNIGGSAMPTLNMQTDAKTWFLDPDRAANGSGISPADAFNSLTTALSLMSAYDVLYIISPKILSSGTGSTGSITGNFTIPKAKQMMSLIGVGPTTSGGRPIRSTRLIGTSGTASPVLTINADSIGLENLRFSFATSCTFAVYAAYGEDTTGYGSNLSMYNCRASGFTSAATIKVIGSQGVTIKNCGFVDNLISIDIRSATATTTDILIQNNVFGSNGTAASLISADINMDAQGSCYIAILGNAFAHLIPSAGAPNRWINVTNVRQGLVAFNSFGGVTGTNYTVGPTGTGVIIPANVGHGPNWSNAALMASTTP